MYVVLDGLYVGFYCNIAMFIWKQYSIEMTQNVLHFNFFFVCKMNFNFKLNYLVILNGKSRCGGQVWQKVTLLHCLPFSWTWPLDQAFALIIFIAECDQLTVSFFTISFFYHSFLNHFLKYIFITENHLLDINIEYDDGK